VTTPPDRRIEPPAAGTGEPATDAEEIARLRAEISALKWQLDRRVPRRRTGVRRVFAALLIMVAALSVTASLVTGWVGLTALNTDRWVATVAPLTRDPRVTAAIAEYTTNQVFEGLDIERRLTEALPGRADLLVGPITGQVRDYVRKTVDRVLRSERFQEVWVAANRLAHEQVVAILLSRSEVVTVHGNEVRIDLLPVVNQVLRALEAELPTLFGRRLNLPDISSGEIPQNLRATIEKSLGVTLPPNFAQFTIYRGDQLSELQAGVVMFRRGVFGLLAVSLGTLALALWISPSRRRTLLQLGLWLVIWLVVVTATIRAIKAQVLAQVPQGTYRTGADAAITTIFSGLRDRGLLLWLGVALAAVMYLCGPGRIPIWLRRQTARAGRYVATGLGKASHRVVADGPAWTHDHLDVLRVAGLVVAVVIALLLSSWTGLLVVAGVLAAYELLVTLVARAGARRIPSLAEADAGAE
jgi:hypothetical protein